MPKASPIFPSLNAGEYSPLLEGRVDYQKYAKGLKVCENFIPLVQGPVTRRPGTRYVAETKFSAKQSRLVRFEFSTEQAYILEFGDLYVRIFKDHALLEAGTGNPFVAAFTPAFGRGGVEVETPYTEAEVPYIQFTQSADVLYMVHPNHPPRRLNRTAATTWTSTEISFKDGPYLPTNDTTTTMTPAAVTGSGITVTASAVTGINNDTGFQSTDVGRFLRIKGASDWGWGIIASVVSTTQITVDIQSDFQGIGSYTDWRLGVWCDTLSYPAAVAFYNDRLYFGGPSDYPQRIDGSVVGDYENFKPSAVDGTVADDDAVSFTLNANQVNSIQWMIDDEKGLFVGTVGGEWVIRASSLGEAITPTNIQANQATTTGVSYIAPRRAGRSVLFLQRARRAIYELAYKFDVDGFQTTDLTEAAEHILRGGVTGLTFQRQPFPMVWMCRTDGTLVGMLFAPGQEALAFHRHIIGGAFGNGQAVVESVETIPTPDGSAEELWLIVKRTINGTTKRYVEYMEQWWDGSQGQEDVYFVDCGLTSEGTDQTSITGLEHLEGATVAVVGDGAAYPNAVVTSGAITISPAADVVHVGFPYTSNLQTERIEAGAADGTAQGKTKRIHRLTVRVWQTLGLKVGPSASNLDPGIFRMVGDVMGAPPPLFDGDKQITWAGGYEKEGRIYIRQDQPLPATILAIMPQLHTEDR